MSKQQPFFSLTALIPVSAFVGAMDGSFLLPAIITATPMIAAIATKTNPSIMILNLKDILDQPCTSLFWVSLIGKAS
jgi:hypothetical protein